MELIRQPLVVLADVGRYACAQSALEPQHHIAGSLEVRGAVGLDGGLDDSAHAVGGERGQRRCDAPVHRGHVPLDQRRDDRVPVREVLVQGGHRNVGPQRDLSGAEGSEPLGYHKLLGGAEYTFDALAAAALDRCAPTAGRPGGRQPSHHHGVNYNLNTTRIPMVGWQS